MIKIKIMKMMVIIALNGLSYFILSNDLELIMAV